MEDVACSRRLKDVACGRMSTRVGRGLLPKATSQRLWGCLWLQLATAPRPPHPLSDGASRRSSSMCIFVRRRGAPYFPLYADAARLVAANDPKLLAMSIRSPEQCPPTPESWAEDRTRSPTPPWIASWHPKGDGSASKHRGLILKSCHRCTHEPSPGRPCMHGSCGSICLVQQPLQSAHRGHAKRTSW